MRWTILFLAMALATSYSQSLFSQDNTKVLAQTMSEDDLYNVTSSLKPKANENDNGEVPNRSVFTVGLKGSLPISVLAETNSNLSFLSSFADGKSGGVGMGLGIYFEVAPIRYLAIETGVNWRTFELAGWDISYSEYQIPIIAKFKSKVNNKVSFALGVGTSYYSQFKGQVDPDGGGPGQTAISLSDVDLRSGFSFIARIELDFEMARNMRLRTELGYERANRSLDIVSHDFVFSIGTGFVLF